MSDAELAGRDALAVHHLVEPIRASLEAQGMAELYETIENPLVMVLAKMEHVGVAVDIEELETLNKKLTDEVESLVEELRTVAEMPDLNLNSPKQLRELLYDQKGLTPIKKTKTGPSTDAATLEKLEHEWPEFLAPLRRHREVEKLRGTYGKGLLAEVAPDGRIHATFNQTVARTGRLSSDQPNLHNIPVRSEEGRLFRRAFVASPGTELLVADYNQIELRCIAHLAQDSGLLEAFNSGQDIHNATASRVFSVEPEDVTIDQRSKAKMVSYGLAYGMEAYGLAQRLEHPRRRGGADPRCVLRGVPEREGLHGPHGRGGPRARLHRDAVRSSPPDPRAVELELPGSSGGRAPGDERRDPGPRRRHLQGGARADRRGAERAGHREPTHPAGPRRGARRGAAATRRTTIGDLVIELMHGAADLDVPLEVNVSWGHTWAAAKG